MKKMHLSVVASIFVSSFALAAPSGAAPAAECNGLKVATGQPGKGYSVVFSDIVKVCKSEVSLCEVKTTGGLDNLNAMSVKEADIGFAQLDTLQTMKNGDENTANLQAIAGLHFNYLHPVVSARGFSVEGEKKLGVFKGEAKNVVIQRFSDLKGQRVALVGSASLMGRQIERNLGYKMQFIDAENDDKAFDMVRKGVVAAAFTVSGWPHGILKGLNQDSGLTLIPYDAPTSSPYVVRSVSYKGIGVYNNNLLAVPNMLLSRPFKGEKAKDVAALKQCISKKLEDLKEGSYQPAWNEIKSLDNTFDWPKFSGGEAAKSKK